MISMLRPMRAAIAVSTLLLVLLSVVPALAYPVTVVDGRGKRITVKAAPKRIISLSPNSTEILFALGLGDRIVGDTTWCNYPPAAKRKSHIGDSKISMEKVISLKPDLILAHAKLNISYIGRLEAAGKTVIAIDPKTYDAVMADIRMVGHATGADARAHRIASHMNAVRAQVRKAASKSVRRKVLFVMQPSPLWVAGPGTVVDEMAGYVNAVNIARDAAPGFNQYPSERALAKAPDIIIVGKGEKKYFLSSPIWRQTKAARANHIYEVDYDLLVRPGPRLADGLLQLSRIVR